MVLITLTILWIAILLFLVLYLGHTPKGRGWRRILWHSNKVRIAAATLVLAVAAIVAIFALHPTTPDEIVEARPIFENYSRTIVQELEKQGALTIDSLCNIDAPKPELAYALPAILSVYNEVVNKPTTPRLAELGETLTIYFDGYKQFKNRSINIVKGIQKKLGPRYVPQMTLGEMSHALKIEYNGKPWDNEQLCSLPAMNASIREKVDPALLMSIIRHISDFDFNYEDENHNKGLMALDSGKNLEQIYIGAKLLKAAVDTSGSIEDAVAALYPIRESQGLNTEWRKSPLKSSWVKEVLDDIQFYRNNGLK